MGDLIRFNSEYVSGMRAARAEVASGDIYCLKSALMLYENDPADSDFQRGHHRALINLHQQQGRKSND
jgi:hypothetical protein